MSAPSSIKLLGISGSLRKHSYNSGALRSIDSLLPEGMTFEMADLADLPFYNADYTRYTALYAQEQWTSGRWTLQGAVRYDNAWSYTPDLQVGPVKWIPIPVAFDGQDLVNWKDVTPRLDAARNVSRRSTSGMPTSSAARRARASANGSAEPKRSR